MKCMWSLASGLAVLALLPGVAWAQARTNQQVAEAVAQNIRAAGLLSGYEIDIEYQNGVATLRGTVSSPQQREFAVSRARSVPEVRQVQNLLQVRPTGQAVQPAPAARPSTAAPATGPIRQVQAQGQPGQLPMPPQGAPMVQEGSVVAPPMPISAGAIPAYGAPPHMTGVGAYDLPHFPNYAWPSYAAYPNYAAVSYPTQYAASAWPYIGPFYPYPQVPLGWRSAHLEWDDGWWYLDFNSRTDRWWWFLNPKNWHGDPEGHHH